MQTSRRTTAHNFQEPAQNVFFWTRNRKTRHKKNLLAKFDKILKNFTFLVTFEANSSAQNFQSENLPAQKKFTFRRSVLINQRLQTNTHSMTYMNSCLHKHDLVSYICILEVMAHYVGLLLAHEDCFGLYTCRFCCPAVTSLLMQL